VDEVSLRNLFHGALDEVTPPKPWLQDAVREQLRRSRPVARNRPSRILLSPAARRLVAAVLVLLVAGTAAAATIAIYERRHNPVPVIPQSGPGLRACEAGTIHMFDKNIGWNGSKRTTDGGKTWRDVSPPPVQGSVKGPSGTCAVDADHEWALRSTGGATYQPTELVLLSTSDGGSSWQQTASIPVPYQVSWRITFSAELEFLDDQHGWLFMEYATQPLQRRIYATSDGGRNWSAVSMAADLSLGEMGFDCSLSGLIFSTVRHGWLTWDCTQGFGGTPGTGTELMAETIDSGRTWAPVRLPSLPSSASPPCKTTSPIFSGSQGVVQETCSAFNAIYSTRDGGVSWTVHILSAFAPVDFLNGTVGFYFWQPDPNGPNTLYRTDDGGIDWTVVAVGLFPGVALTGLTFLTSRDGFVDGGGSAPWWTHDGGKSWSLPAPYRSVGDTVCPLSADPGAALVPMSVKMVSPTAGWSVGARRTTDGGATWSKVAPPAPPGQSVSEGEFFLDADHAWIVKAVGSKTACADHFVVSSTSDGGATWHAGTPVAVKLANPQVMLIGGWAPIVDFVDAEHGWVLVHQSAWMALSPPLLYSTVDGGKSWLLLGSPATQNASCTPGSNLDFVSPTTGWLNVGCGDPNAPAEALVTRDGGSTWNMQLIASTPCGNCQPRFIDAMNGWYLDPNTPLLMMTTDGGQTWHRHGLPRFGTYTCQGKFGPTTCSLSYVQAGTFLSPTEGWITVTDFAENGPPLTVHVERTLDGGRTWSVIYTRSVAADIDLSGSLTFVDPSDGFWWLGPDLFRTTDGGRTWTKVRIVYA